MQNFYKTEETQVFDDYLTSLDIYESILYKTDYAYKNGLIEQYKSDIAEISNQLLQMTYNKCLLSDKKEEAQELVKSFVKTEKIGIT